MNHSTIYTKKGDAGETGIQGGQRLPKNSLRIEALGTCDELNSTIGVLVSWLPKEADLTRERLVKIQRQIFSIGATIAGNSNWPTTEKHVLEIENWIDELDAQLPKLTGFILPGGSTAGAACHFARAICRRCERNIVRLNHEASIDPIILQYLNRLSDLLFVLARHINRQMGANEQKWHQ